MIRHVVLLKFQKNSPLEEIKKKIEDLKNHIPQIISISANIDIKFEENASDMCIITEVKDVYDLEIYAKHPKHLEVINFIKKYAIERRVADFHV